MKIEFRTVVFALVVISMGVGAYMASPALRARVSRETHSLLGWTEAARQADPVGFTEHVERRLKEDQHRLNSTRRELAIEVAALVKKEKEQRGLLEFAEQFAEEFRDVYQQALDRQSFPVSVRSAEYNDHEVLSQVSLLLAEAEGYRNSLNKMGEVRQKAEQRLEQLTVRLSSTEAQLTSIAAQRGLLRARVLTNEGENLLAQVDQLLNGNSVVIHGNPVRSVRELLAASEQTSERHPNLETARRFLTAKPDAKTQYVRQPESDQLETKPAAPEAPQAELGHVEPAVELQLDQQEAPIFEQK